MREQFDPAFANRALSLVEWLAKLAGALVLVWGFLAKAWAPYKRSRDKYLAQTIREVLKPELAAIHEIIDNDTGWKYHVERNSKRLDGIFIDLDKLLEVAFDNRERHDETNELLDALGFTSDRRGGTERRREEVSGMVAELAERRKDRRRRAD